MPEILRTPEQKRWAVVQAAAVMFFVFGYSFQYTNIYLWNTISATYLHIGVILFVAFHFYFVRVRSSVESKLLLAYCVWLLLTRIINGDPWLLDELGLVFTNVFLLAVLPTAILLKPESRKKMFSIIAIVLGVYFTVVAVCGIWSALFSVAVGNPFCPEFDIADFGIDPGRLTVLSLNPNHISICFFISLWLLVYLFFVVRKKLWRIPIVLAAVLIYLAIMLTYSRNVILAFSVCMGLLLDALILERIKSKKLWVKVCSFILVLCICVPSIFVGTEKIYGAFSELAQSITTSSEIVVADEQGDGGTADGVFMETRGLEDSGRLPIYRCVAETIIMEPSKLFVGRLHANIMDTVNTLLPEAFYDEPDFEGFAHPHNSYLYVLMLTGLPGFILTMAFLLLLLKKCLALYFSKSPKVCIEHKVLVLALCGMMMYNLFETALFAHMDIRTIGFMLIAGAVIAYSNECVE